jgi:hypothetical protein
MSRISIACTLFIAGILTVACDKVALLAPTQSTITLSVDQTSVASNGTAEVTASVIEQSGTAVHDGTEVTFTSSVGTVEPRVARTERGIARTTFRAGTTSGTARIGAFSGAAVAEVVELLVGGAAASTVSVRTDPSTVPQSGGVVQVIAVVRDPSGNPLPNADVVFTADNGSLGSNSVRADQNGEARTTLSTNRVTIVKASVAGKEGQATVSVTTAPTVSLTASTTNPAVGVPVLFTITPGTSTTGGTVTNVSFDPGDGSPVRNLGAVTTAQPVQHVYNSAGSFTAKAITTDQANQRGESAVVLVVQRSTITPTITANPSEASVGQQVTFTVQATPAAGGPPIQFVRVRFCDGAEIPVSPGQSFVRSFNSPGPCLVTVTVTDTAGQTHQGSTSVTIRPRAAIEVTLDADSGDANQMECTPARTSNLYPKQCTVFTQSLFGRAPAVLPARVVFTAGFAGTTPSNIIQYEWNFGDGRIERTTNRNVDRVYTQHSTYNVSVTVTTADGGTGTQRLTLVVQGTSGFGAVP